MQDDLQAVALVHLYVPQSPVDALHEPEPLHVPRCETVESGEPSVHVSAPHFVAPVG